MITVYVLEGETERRYVGITNDLKPGSPSTLHQLRRRRSDPRRELWAAREAHGVGCRAPLETWSDRKTFDSPQEEE